MTMAFDADASSTSDSVMPPTEPWMTLRRTSSVDSRRERVADRLDRALHVGLEDDLQLLDLAALDLLVEIVERDLRGLRHLGLALLAAAMLGDLARLRVVLHDDEDVAGLGHAAEAEDLDRRRRSGRLDAPAPCRRSSRGRGRTARRRRTGSPTLERAFLHEDRRHRAAAAIEARLDDRALRAPASGWPSARARRPAAGSSRAAASMPSFVFADTGTTIVSPPHSSGARP